MAEDFSSFLRNSDLQRRLDSIKERVRNEYLRFWQIHAPHFTDHGENHCNTIAMNLLELLKIEVVQSLNEYEIFSLLSSVWLHDIGIMYRVDSQEDLKEIRRTHNERSRYLVLNEFRNLLLPQERILIGDLCWSHSKNADITTLSETKILRHSQIGNKEIRQQFLAALLRLSDALDMCCTRTSEFLSESEQLSEESQFYHALHSRISGLIRKETQIIIDINYMDEEEKNVLSEYIIIPVNFELESVRNILAKNSVIFTDIVPRYNFVNDLEPIPDPPVDDGPTDISEERSELLKIRLKALSLLREGKRVEAEPVILELTKKYQNDARSWAYYGQYYLEEGDYEKAAEGFQNASNIEPMNREYLHSYGHVLGEYKLDSDASLDLFKRAYDISPGSTQSGLNYAECLIVDGQGPNALPLIINVLNKTQSLKYVVYAQFLKLCCNAFIKNDIEELKDEITVVMYLLIDTNAKDLTWVFNSIRLHIEKSKLKDEIKQVLRIFIDHFDSDISKDELFSEIRKLI